MTKMYYLKNRRTGEEIGMEADSFQQACKRVGWPMRESQFLRTKPMPKRFLEAERSAERKLNQQ